MGRKTNKWVKGDTSLWALIIMFSLLSLVFVYSSSSRAAVMEHTSTFSIMLKQMGHILFGIVFIYLLHIVPLKYYRIFSYFLFIGAFLLVLLTLFMGESRNESTRWISIFGFSIQPSEFAKPALVLFVAKVLEDNKLNTFREFMCRLILPVFAFIIPIIWEGFSTGALLSATVFIMLLVSQVPFRHIAKAAGIVILVAGLFYGGLLLHKTLKKDQGTTIASSSRLETVETRISSFLGIGEAKEKKENDQVLYSKVAIATGGIGGKIPGNGTLRHVLPLSNSDYIYSIIVEETGLIGGVFVIGLYFWLLYSVIVIAKKCEKVFSAMLVCGLGIMIVLQALAHIMVNVGIMPVTGQTLPLISSGGSSVLAVSFAFGMMLSVSRALEDESLYSLELPGNEKKPIVKENENPQKS